MRKNNPFLTASTIATLAVASFAIAHDQDKPTKPASEHASHASHATASDEMHRIMHEGAKASMKMTGNVDRDFAAMMSMHHEQAIKMIDIELQHGDDAALKSMAEKMKAAQQKEIEELSRFK